MRGIINSWDLISGCPENEFDSINHLLLGQLLKGSDKYKISQVLIHEIRVNYGIDISEDEVEVKIKEVFEYWTNST
ncbi:MAG: hypothetical protein ABJP80_19720 [Algibacter sp.]